MVGKPPNTRRLICPPCAGRILARGADMVRSNLGPPSGAHPQEDGPLGRGQNARGRCVQSYGTPKSISVSYQGLFEIARLRDMSVLGGCAKPLAFSHGQSVTADAARSSRGGFLDVGFMRMFRR